MQQLAVSEVTENVLSALMTLNRGDFARLFPALPLIVPDLNPQLPDAPAHGA